MKQEIRRFLSELPHFSFLSEEEMEKVVSKASFAHFKKGESISIQGKSRIENVLAIIAGQLSLYQDDEGEEELIGYIKKGEVFGGISVMLNAGISLRTAKADRELGAISIPGSIIMEVCTQNKSKFLQAVCHSLAP